MRALLLLVAIGCGGSKTTAPSNTAKVGSDSPKVAVSDDCMGGGVVHVDGNSEAGCKFFGEVMGPPPDAGTGIHMLKCCYTTAELACKNTGGCEIKDCTFDAKATAPAPVTCKDTTHGGVGPTNP